MRKKLTVTTISEPKTYTNKYNKQATEHSFKATDEHGVELVYKTSNETFAKEIVAGNVLDAEVEVVDVNKGENVYTSRYIRDIFKDGKSTKFEGGKRFGRSAEEIQSIERQASCHDIARLKAAGVEIPKDIDQVFWDWTRKSLQVAAAQKVSEKPDKVESPQESVTTPASATTGAKGKARKAEDVKTLKDLLQACYMDFSLSEASVCKELGVEDSKDIKTLGMSASECYLKIKGVMRP